MRIQWTETWGCWWCLCVSLSSRIPKQTPLTKHRAFHSVLLIKFHQMRPRNQLCECQRQEIGDWFVCVCIHTFKVFLVFGCMQECKTSAKEIIYEMWLRLYAVLLYNQSIIWFCIIETLERLLQELFLPRAVFRCN